MLKEPIAARYAYFAALRKHWTELLVSLRRDVLPLYIPRWGEGDIESRFALFESWNNLKSDETRKELAGALVEWAARFRITEDWIFQTALDTLQGFSQYTNTPFYLATKRARTEDRWFWLYAPRSSYVLFEPHLENNYWPAASDETWEVFRHRMESQFIKQLTAYRHLVETALGVRKADNLARHAEWTVRYQKGETASEIARALKGPYRDRTQSVYRAIERFAKLIHLNLTKRRR